ncbi:MAG: carbonic anhydrase [Proteobacteria bacterium]|nr:carbonic anhydrase [Pseudomonadota bacterium]
MIHCNPVTDSCEQEYLPDVEPSAFIHPLAVVIGRVYVGKRVMISPFASVRADEGHPIFIGDDSNVQDGVIVHGLETECRGQPVESNTVEVDGLRYAVHIGARSSLAHQAQIHGPARVGDDSFVGMQALVFRARVGRGCVIEPGCILMGVSVGDRRYVPAGTVLRDQKEAEALPLVSEDYPLKALNKEVVEVNTSLAKGYHQLGLK